MKQDHGPLSATGPTTVILNIERAAYLGVIHQFGLALDELTNSFAETLFPAPYQKSILRRTSADFVFRTSVRASNSAPRCRGSSASLGQYWDMLGGTAGRFVRTVSRSFELLGPIDARDEPIGARVLSRGRRFNSLTGSVTTFEDVEVCSKTLRDVRSAGRSTRV